MPVWLKVVLIVLGVAVVGLTVAGYAGYQWLQRNKGRLVEMGEAAIADGRAFGQGKDTAACEAESFRRLDEKGGLFDEVSTKFFLRACLEEASSADGYCDGVPQKDAVMATVKWALARCQQAGRAHDQRCSRLFQSVQDFCHSPPLPR